MRFRLLADRRPEFPLSAGGFCRHLSQVESSAAALPLRIRLEFGIPAEFRVTLPAHRAHVAHTLNDLGSVCAMWVSFEDVTYCYAVRACWGHRRLAQTTRETPVPLCHVRH